MKLLGIKVHPECVKNSKVLRPGWFPFGHYEEPSSADGLIDIKKYPKEIESIYSRSGMPEISVNAIVGKNGAGKSTLLEMFYKIVNNFAVHAIGPRYATGEGRQLKSTGRIYADLYFELDGIQYKIACKGHNVSFLQGQNGKFKEIIIDESNRKEVLQSFFYTIVTNYSLYAFDTYEHYNNDDVEKDTHGWVRGLFHKNDGYFTPIVITPFRHDGSIDIYNEIFLAEQRINVLALLAEAKGTTFIPGYRPQKIKKIFDERFLNAKLDSLREEFNSHSLEWLSEDQMLEAFKEAWLTRLFTDTNIPFDRNDKFLVSALKYLAYKSLKLTLKYSDYKGIMKYEKRREDYLSHNMSGYYDAIKDRGCKPLINKIFYDIDSCKTNSRHGEHNHLTLKIEQTYEFIKRRLYDISEGRCLNSVDEEMDVSAFLKGHMIQNYSDMYQLMPPPFFRTVIEFVHTERTNDSAWQTVSEGREKLTLDTMSSGERHFLNCLSYVLYHIKNIESIVPDVNRIKYRHICLVFDEIELYFHPEYQRKFVNMMIEALDWCKVSSDSIKSIQILLVTHSPFILTDIFTHNTLYLNNGESCKVTDETFGANYYDMLGNSFFFTKSAFGDIASKFVSELYGKKTYSADDYKLLDYIGDEMLSTYIRNKMLKRGKNV